MMALDDSVIRDFQSLVDAVPSGLIIINPTGTIMMINAGVSSILGYRDNDLVGNPIEMLVPTRYADVHPLKVKSFFDSPTQRPMGLGRDLFARHKDGHEIPVEIGLSPINTDLGVHVVASVVDISVRKQSEDRFRAVVDGAPNGLVMIDSTGEIHLANASTASMFGYEIEELLGKQIDILIPDRFRTHHSTQVTEYFVRPEKRAMGGGRDLFGVHKNGREFPVEIGLSPIQTAHGLLVLASIIDITDRKTAERLREAYAAELERRNQELDEFSYVASHDLQEPLRKLISFSKLLEIDIGGDLNDKAQMDVHQITTSALRMRTLIQDLLRLSRAGSADLTSEIVDLNRCVDNALGALESRVEETRASISRCELPQVRGDPTLYTQLFQNLIGNALKFKAEDRTPEVCIGAEREAGAWRISVSDNGIGIRAEYADRIFSPFKRLHSRNKYDGTGVGLSICRKIVERHGGSISAIPNPDCGVKLSFTVKDTEDISCQQQSNEREERSFS